MSKTHCKCLDCDKPAVVFVSFVTSNSVENACYCLQHAKEKGVLNGVGYQLLENETNATVKEVPDWQTCPVCFYKQEDFIRSKKMGCPNCYEHFEHLMKPLFKKVYEIPFHLGKVPKTMANNKNVNKRYIYLEEKMKKALAQENYEEAANIRDQIASLKGTTKKGK